MSERIIQYRGWGWLEFFMGVVFGGAATLGMLVLLCFVQNYRH